MVVSGPPGGDAVTPDNATAFFHRCGQKIVVLGWTGGYWRKPERGRGICGVIPFKGNRCVCGEVLGPSEAERAQEFTGKLFETEVAG